jgi:hypothetical protein
MATFGSNEEFFQAVNDLIAKLQVGGHHFAAAELQTGFRSLNGLTDGWADFLQSIESILATVSKRFAPDDQKTLEKIREAVHAIVYRR